MGVEFPVLLFTDNHPSHFSIEISEKCESLGIILVSLFPNSTFISQPLDCSTFAEVKDEWDTELDRRRMKTPSFRVNVGNFATVLKGVCNTALTPQVIKRGFRITGLYPFDVDAIPFHQLNTKRNKRSTQAVVCEADGVSLGSSAYLDTATESEIHTEFHKNDNEADHSSTSTSENCTDRIFQESEAWDDSLSIDELILNVHQNYDASLEDDFGGDEASTSIAEILHHQHADTSFEDPIMSLEDVSLNTTIEDNLNVAGNFTNPTETLPSGTLQHDGVDNGLIQNSAMIPESSQCELYKVCVKIKLLYLCQNHMLLQALQSGFSQDMLKIDYDSDLDDVDGATENEVCFCFCK